MNIKLHFCDKNINWDVLSELYRIAPLGKRSAKEFETVFSNSMFKCFAFDGDVLVGAGRAMADGCDCSYICDVAIHPDYQGRGVGKKVVESLMERSKEHRKIILYANPGKEGFYSKLGFKKMNTAMALFHNEDAMIAKGVISAD